MDSQLPEDVHCLGCDYSLRGLPEPVCPECGRAFDPDDPSTYRRGPRIPKWRRWAGPPKTWHILLAIASTLGLIQAYSEPGYLTILPSAGGLCCIFIPLAVLTLGCLTLNCAVRVVATVCDSTRAKLDRDQAPKPSAGRWSVLPLCLLVLISASITRWPLHARFHLSHAALERAAASYLDGTATRKTPGRVGLFRFDHVRQQDGGVGFMNDYGFWRLWGFFYSPSDTPPSTEILWSWRIAPNWFVFEWDF